MIVTIRKAPVRGGILRRASWAILSALVLTAGAAPLAAQPLPDSGRTPGASGTGLEGVGGPSSPASRKGNPRRERPFTVTLSTINLLLAQAEVAAEYNPIPPLGIGVLGGGGLILDEGPGNSAWEAGFFTHWYPSYLHGFFLGAEAFWARLDFGEKTEEDGAESDFCFPCDFSMWGVYHVAAVGPLIGYKVIRKSGFTVQTQAGFYIGSTLHPVRASFLWPTFDVNLGWSF
jgi:hypothetical protein